MTDTNNLTVCVLDTPGAVGALKASQLARLIEGYIRTHPEVTQKQEETND